jgi:hypothetical protein
MTKYLPLLIFLFLSFPVGCAHNTEEIKKEQSFTIHPFETFFRESTGETGLFIEGEDWYSLFDLSGFQETDENFTSPNQFIRKENEDGLLVSVFAEKIPGAGDQDACMKCYLSRLEQQKKKVMGKVPTTEYVQESGRKTLILDPGTSETTVRDIFYHPYYKGYCFAFHLTVPATDAGMTKGIELIDSIKFIEGKPSDVMISRYFNIWSRRLLLTCPGEWRCSLQKIAVNAFKISSIIFEPETGNDFRIHLSPVEGFRTKKVKPEEVKESAMKSMSNWEGRSTVKPELQEIRHEAVTAYYFDVADKNAKKDEYPFIRQGYAFLDGGAELYFIIYYKDQNSMITNQGLNMLSDARIIDLP